MGKWKKDKVKKRKSSKCEVITKYHDTEYTLMLRGKKIKLTTVEFNQLKGSLLGSGELDNYLEDF